MGIEPYPKPGIGSGADGTNDFKRAGNCRNLRYVAVFRNHLKD